MILQSEQQKIETISRLSRISLLMVLGNAVVMGVIGYLVTQNRMSTGAFKLDLITEVIFFVVLVLFPAAHIVRKNLFAKMSAKEQLNGKDVSLTTINIVMAAFAMAIADYGMVVIFLGNKFEMLFLFIAISLIHYQLFRLRLKDFEALKSDENDLHQ